MRVQKRHSNLDANILKFVRITEVVDHNVFNFSRPFVPMFLVALSTIRSYSYLDIKTTSSAWHLVLARVSSVSLVASQS